LPLSFFLIFNFKGLQLEQLKQSAAIKSAESNLLNAIDLITLPLISQFRIFQFSGLANDAILTPNFLPADLNGRYIVIKAVKIVPYYDAAAVDFFVDDGAGTVNAETIPANTRINRIFDVYDYGCQLTLEINGGRVPMFPNEVPIAAPAADGNVPLDLDIDNIFYKYPEKLEGINPLNIRLDAQIVNDINNDIVDVPNVKIFLQCYLI
jgi:hypothetical protein